MKRSIGITAALAALLLAEPGWADAGAADLGALTAAIQNMRGEITRLQQTVDEQNRRIEQLEARPARESSGGASTGTEAVPWMQGLKQSGDLRLRQEYFDFYDKTNDAGSTGTANDRSRNRFRVRLRWGLEKDLGEDWKAGFRLATGSSTDNVSTNQTLGNRGYFTFKDIFIDRAYAQYSPSAWKDRGAVKGVTIGAGKVENPFLRYSTPMVWDADVTPEGLYEKATFRLLDSGPDRLDLNVALGQFISNENAGTETDAEVYGYQGALTWSNKRFGEKPLELTFAASYYDYPSWFQTVTNNTAGVSFLRTNTSALDDPRILDLYPEAAFHWRETPVTLWFDYAVNVGSIDATREALDSAHSDDDGWGAGFKVGKASKKGSWEAGYGYFEIGANAVVAAFNDGDFGGPGYSGHTNRKGHKLAFTYQLTDAVSVGWAGFLVEPVNPTAAAANSTDESVFRSQVDLNYKF